MSDTVLSERAEGVLRLTLNRPHKKNAFNIEQWRACGEMIAAAKDDDSVRAVLITGAGGNFSSGTDLNEFLDSGKDHPFPACERAFAELDKPLIGAATGIAIGGGATLLFHCDVLCVGASLRMRLPFVCLGVVPEFGSSYTLQQSIGYRRAAELFFTADWIDAERAVACGIANSAHPDEDLLEAASERAGAIARWPLNSLRETKRCLKLSHREPMAAAMAAEREGMMRQAGSAENIEAISAFLKQRR